MAVSPKELNMSRYKNTDELEDHIDQKLRTNAYEANDGFVYVNVPVNFICKDKKEEEQVEELRRRYLAAGWTYFDLVRSLFTGEFLYFRLGL